METDPDDRNELAAALGAAGDIVYDWDLVSDTIRWLGPNSTLHRRIGLDALTTGAQLRARIASDDAGRREDALSGHFESGVCFDCEYRLRQDDGSLCWVHDRGTASFDADGKPVRMRGVLRGINLRKAHEARLEQMANFDDLTGHFNRARLRDALHRALLDSELYRHPGVFLVVDVDKLAPVNDAYGYAAADVVIIAVGQRVSRQLRLDHIMGRVGGDSYGIVLTRCTADDARDVCERILNAFRERPINTPAGPVHVSVSIGAVEFPHEAGTTADIINKAERALHEAKMSGRDTFAFYRHNVAQQRQERASVVIGEQVKAAVHGDRVVFAFQPVVNSSDRSVAFHECLLRMLDTEGRLVPAKDFIPAVERLGLTRMIDRRGLDLAVEELSANDDIALAVNISGLTVADQGWLEHLQLKVAGAPGIARRLIIEITETAAMHDIEQSAQFVRAVRSLGCQVALDDFGAGYTSFRHLRTLPVDIVKIDGSFVRNLSTSEENQLFIRTLFGLARGFGLKTVAECVESRQDADFLTAEGVDLLQGYQVGVPSIDRPWITSATDETSRTASGQSR